MQDKYHPFIQTKPKDFYYCSTRGCRLIKNLHLRHVPSFKMNCKPFTTERKTRLRLKDLQTIEHGSPGLEVFSIYSNHKTEIRPGKFITTVKWR